MSCLNCGRITKKDTSYCNTTCETNFKNLFNQPVKPAFRTFQEAGKFYNKDFRTVKQFEGMLFTIDKTIPAAHTKWVTCKICGESSSSSSARSGYCSDCTSKGLGKQNQGKHISKMYQGSGNPNFLDGTTLSTEYQTNDWYKLKKELNFTHCALTNKEEEIDYHHILPRWFCKLADIDIFDPHNIIGLNREYHKAVHHLQLDVVLLPILYSLYKKDARQLRSRFVSLLQLHKVHQFPVDQLQSQSLFALSRYPGRKKLLHLLPEFLQPFLAQKELQS
jgi:hypothetical protein